MNHKLIYDRLMDSRRLLKEARNIQKVDGEYFENHHIIPKSKGGDNTKENLVLLTAREHFLAHKLLWIIYRDRSSALGFHKMCSVTKNQKRVVNSKDYEEAREAFKLTNIGNDYGKHNKGRIVSQEQRDNQSKVMKGKFLGDKNPFYGKKHTEEAKQKIKQNRVHVNVEDRKSYKGARIVLKDDVFVAEFKTTKEVATFLKCSESNIKRVLSGNQKTTKGFQIIYKNNN
jgi:hypothetical protein